MSIDIYILHDNSYDMIFPYRTLAAAKEFGEKVRPGFGKWQPAGFSMWTRGEYQKIVLRTLE